MSRQSICFWNPNYRSEIPVFLFYSSPDDSSCSLEEKTPTIWYSALQKYSHKLIFFPTFCLDYTINCNVFVIIVVPDRYWYQKSDWYQPENKYRIITTSSKTISQLQLHSDILASCSYNLQHLIFSCFIWLCMTTHSCHHLFTVSSYYHFHFFDGLPCVQPRLWHHKHKTDKTCVHVSW